MPWSYFSLAGEWGAGFGKPPYSELDSSGVESVHTKDCVTGGSAELAETVFDQIDSMTPQVFYDGLSDKIVSVDYGGVSVSEYGDYEAIDEDTLMGSLALKAVLSDPDIHGVTEWENIQVTGSGRAYPIDFGRMGAEGFEETLEKIVDAGAEFLEDKHPQRSYDENRSDACLEIRDRAFRYAGQVDTVGTAQELGEMFDLLIEQDLWEWRNIYDRVFTGIERLQDGEWIE